MIYIYMLSVCLVCQINCVGGVTWTKHAHAQSLFFLAVKPVTPVLFISYTLELDEKEAEARPLMGTIFLVIGRAKRAPHWGVQSRFRVIYV